MTELTGLWCLSGFIVLGGIFAQLVACWFVRIQLFQGALSNSKAWSLAIAKHQLAVFKPDVVVGFSWGGAVLIHMLMDKTWDGPTVLHAPAHRIMATTKGQEKADAWVLNLGTDDCSDDDDDDGGGSGRRHSVIVVHSKEDQVETEKNERLH